MPSPLELAQDLERIADILMEENFIYNPSPLRSVRDQLKRNPKKYSINGLIFHSVNGEYVRSGIWDKSLDVKMSGQVDINGDDFVYSNVSKMVIDIEYSCLKEEDVSECKGCWHMDYHVMPGNPPLYMHPDYHLHHGGKKIAELNNFGDLVILDTPRVMHHPLDIILGIDFVISNFFSEREWRKLRARKEYHCIVEKAQESWWKDYYSTLSSYWDSKNKSTRKDLDAVISAKKLNPHFI
ncbi:MAG TPA: hypothetical protein VH187_18025 [Scandinavium sp.]|jgi:hypothetical protein|uniref:hypothetical protein n=1 Tax=Enterobacterales TaxID=91347 RepID=UPI002B0DEACD|nr:hypothetical protein [Scandinavium sp.]HEP0987817.1 hypothetical protein [Enterobacter ludwigii]HEX4503037.1 hypothetical protein [Scandinavium sp.]